MTFESNLNFFSPQQNSGASGQPKTELSVFIDDYLYDELFTFGSESPLQPLTAAEYPPNFSPASSTPSPRDTMNSSPIPTISSTLSGIRKRDDGVSKTSSNTTENNSSVGHNHISAVEAPRMRRLSAPPLPSDGVANAAIALPPSPRRQRLSNRHPMSWRSSQPFHPMKRIEDTDLHPVVSRTSFASQISRRSATAEPLFLDREDMTMSATESADQLNTATDFGAMEGYLDSSAPRIASPPLLKEEKTRKSSPHDPQPHPPPLPLPEVAAAGSESQPHANAPPVLPSWLQIINTALMTQDGGSADDAESKLQLQKPHRTSSQAPVDNWLNPCSRTPAPGSPLPTHSRRQSGDPDSSFCKEEEEEARNASSVSAASSAHEDGPLQKPEMPPWHEALQEQPQQQLPQWLAGCGVSSIPAPGGHETSATSRLSTDPGSFVPISREQHALTPHSQRTDMSSVSIYSSDGGAAVPSGPRRSGGPTALLQPHLSSPPTAATVMAVAGTPDSFEGREGVIAPSKLSSAEVSGDQQLTTTAITAAASRAAHDSRRRRKPRASGDGETPTSYTLNVGGESHVFANVSPQSTASRGSGASLPTETTFVAFNQ